MTDFRALAKSSAGLEAWAELDESERRDLVRAEKVAWLEGRLGDVVGRETYAAWLKRQPVAVQDRVLGVTRARLFRAGGLTIDRFTDALGRTLTLEQLAAIEPAAFRKAGVEPPASTTKGGK